MFGRLMLRMLWERIKDQGVKSKGGEGKLHDTDAKDGDDLDFAVEWEFQTFFWMESVILMLMKVER